MDQRLIVLHRRASDIFHEADRDGNGWLSKKELKRVIHGNDYIRFELRTAGGRPWKDFWAELDVDGDGKIEEQELINYLTKVQVEKTNDSLDTVKDLAREIFERADRDGNGVLSKRELKRVLHEDDDLRDELRAAHGRHWKDFWTELDANGDGQIEFEELVEYIDKAHKQHVDNAVASAAEARSNPAAAEEKADKGTDETSTGGESTARTDETFGERLARMRAHVRDIFERADRDKNGWLSKKELKRVLHEDDDLRYELRTSGGRPWKEFWAELDVDNDGRIEEKELVDYLMKVLTEKASKHHASLKERAKDIFERADRDKNGWLSKKELKRVLHEDDDLRDELRTAHGRHWKDFWTELDANEDGRIELPELIAYMDENHRRRLTAALEGGKQQEDSTPTRVDMQHSMSEFKDDRGYDVKRDTTVTTTTAALQSSTTTTTTTDSTVTSTATTPTDAAATPAAPSEMERKLQALERRAYAAEAQVLKLEDDLEEARRGGARDEIEELQRALARKDERISELEATVARLREEAAQKRSDADQERAVETELRRQVEEAEKKAQQAVEERDLATAKMRMVSQDFEDLQVSHAGAEARVGMLMEQIEALQSRVDEFNEKGEATAAATQAQADAEKACSECEDKLSTAQAEVVQLKQQLGSVLEELAAAKQKQASEAEAALQAKDDEIARLKRQLNTCEEEKGKATEAAAQAKGAGGEADTKLRAELDTSRAECEELKQEIARLKEAAKAKTAARARKSSATERKPRAGPRPQRADPTHARVSTTLKDSGLNEGDLVYHAPGKYKLPGQDHILNVRIVGKNIMVRVGGGWTKLEDYLKDHRHHIEDARVRYSLGIHNKRSSSSS